MKTIIEYQCEICRTKYKIQEDAMACEKQGVFSTDKFIQGLLFEYNHNGYVGIFAFPEAAKPYERDSHLGKSVNWACRNNRYGDSLGDEKCGGNGFLKTDTDYFNRWVEYHKISKEHENGLEFNRMVNFLKSQNITPTYYNHKKELITVK